MALPLRNRSRGPLSLVRRPDEVAPPQGIRGLPSRLPSARTMGLAIGAGRTAVGAAFLAAPELSVRVLGLDTATARRVTWLAQMTAARDAALGAGTLAATARGSRSAGGWLLAGAVADFADAAVLATALRRGRLRGAATTGIAVGAVLAAGVAGWAAADGLRRR